MTESAKEIMGVKEISVVADKGYYDGEDIQKCEQNGTTCYIPKVGEYKPAPDPKYNRDKFRYDSENDCYVCPEGQRLNLSGTRTKDGEITRKNIAIIRFVSYAPNAANAPPLKKPDEPPQGLPNRTFLI
ncbi:MAG: hypothetical protein LBK41_02945 [Clostridiales bacterium]|jgi:hypothetical protein|nr:hypothetical protein [Clostridiales bacterium]